MTEYKVVPASTWRTVPWPFPLPVPAWLFADRAQPHTRRAGLACTTPRASPNCRARQERRDARGDRDDDHRRAGRPVAMPDPSRPRRVAMSPSPGSCRGSYGQTRAAQRRSSPRPRASSTDRSRSRSRRAPDPRTTLGCTSRAHGLRQDTHANGHTSSTPRASPCCLGMAKRATSAVLAREHAASTVRAARSGS